jgi:LCP family protein required for cell wall assembly
VNGSRSAGFAGKAVIALLSLIVLGGSGLGWSQLHRLSSGMSTADVLDHGAASTATSEQNILLVGLDTRNDAQGNPLPQDLLTQLHAGSSSDGGDNTDTMIVIHIPAGGGAAVAFSIPRDSYVQLAGGYGKHKINSAYTYAEVAAVKKLSAQGLSGAQLNVQAAQAGAKNAIQTVEQFTGLTITHFASVNLVGFYDVSEAIGGVPVCLNSPVRDSYSGANFPAGVQTLSGTQALEFVRQRHGLPNGDLDRIKRQQVFMASMAHTVLSAGTLTSPTKLSNLVDAIKKSVTIDQNWDVLSFAQQLQSMSAGKIQFQTIPVENIDLKTPDGDSVQVDPAQVQAFIRTAIGGRTASGGASSTEAPSGPLTGDPQIAVDVVNASGVPGLAGRAEDDLVGHGFAAGTVGNASTRQTTVVDYAAGEDTAAQQVAQYLGASVQAVPDSAVSAGHLRIVVGTDYAGPGSQPAVSPAAMTPPPPPPITAGGVTCVN